MEQNELEVYEYNGYSITKDGTVRNQNGKVMSVSDGQISLTIHGKKRRRLAGRIVWAAINGRELTAKEVLVYRDGIEITYPMIISKFYKERNIFPDVNGRRFESLTKRNREKY